MTRARARTGARRGTPVTVAADAVLRLRLPAALLVAVREAAGAGGVSAWIRAAAEARLSGLVGEVDRIRDDTDSARVLVEGSDPIWLPRGSLDEGDRVIVSVTVTDEE